MRFVRGASGHIVGISVLGHWHQITGTLLARALWRF